MLSLRQPVWGFAGNILGIMTIWVAGWQIRAWQQQDEFQFGLRQRWHMCLAAHLLAALICTFVQYIYMRYFDNGQMISTLTELYSNPQYSQFMTETMQDSSGAGYNPDMIIATLQKMTLSQLTMEFMILNAFIAIVLSLPTMFVAKVRTTKPTKQQA